MLTIISSLCIIGLAMELWSIHYSTVFHLESQEDAWKWRSLPHFDARGATDEFLAERYIYVSHFHQVANNNPIVQTVNGKVVGKTLKSFSENDFYAFQGIPFAEPPIGDLRFQAPQPPKNWEGVLDSRNSNKECIQIYPTYSTGEGEDCLYLNVYTPLLPNENRNVSLPVLVFIHGGAFLYGNGKIDDCKPYKMMDYGIVLVNFQYRLGVLGFLSTGDLECPGNYGLKDQQLALRWVQANIHNFGGDPSRVTIGGQSAGAASVGLQLLGPNSEELFRGAIQASGSPLASWTLQRNPTKYAYLIASHIEPNINETNTSKKELMKFLRNVDVSRIKEISLKIFRKDSIAKSLNNEEGFVFTTVIEPVHDGAFLTETAFNKFKSGDFQPVPIFIGITSEEGRSFAHGSTLDELLEKYDSNPELIVTPSAHIINKDIGRKVGQDIRNFYAGNGTLFENKGPALKFLTDAGFGRPNIKQAQMAAKYNDVYFYEFGYSGDLGRQGVPVEYIPGAYSVQHTEDLRYIFVDIENKEEYSEKDILTMDRLVLLWTNFVKFLNPTPGRCELLQNVIWPPVSQYSFPYLLINETLEVKYDFKKPMMNEYARIFDLYAIPPFDTY